MKILIYSPLFYPSIGGLETVVMTLASQFASKGHDVKIVTQTPGLDHENFLYTIIRKPKMHELFQLGVWSEIYFQPSISLKGTWPVLTLSKPWVVSHNNWYTRDNGKVGWQDYLKKFVIRFAKNISVSRAIADHISPSSRIIPNPYREDVFYERSNIERKKELVFLGRLVSDKGVDLLIDSVAQLKTKGLTPHLTIIGIGPEEMKLKRQAENLGLNNQVDFLGVKINEELAKLLNEHKIMVIPSRWNEPFGVVALEGIACGCVVVGSNGGGLKEAIGPCGMTFPNGDENKLTEILLDLLTKPDLFQSYRFPAYNHLIKHRPSYVADQYLEVFKEAII